MKTPYPILSLVDDAPDFPEQLGTKAATKSPQAAKSWLARLQQIPDNAVKALFEQLPLTEATPVARHFSLTLLALNKQRLLEPKP